MPTNQTQEQYDAIYQNASAGQKATLKNALSKGDIVISAPTPPAPVTPIAPATPENDGAIDPNKVQEGGMQTMGTPAPVEPVKPVEVKTEKPVDVKFGADANLLTNKNPQYQETRNQQIADSVKAQLQQIANSGVRVDDAIRDQALASTLAQYGVTPDWNDVNWQNTISSIYKKTTGNQKWSDVYSGINQSSALIGKYTNGKDLYDAISKGDGSVSQNQLNLIKQYNPGLYEQYVQAKEDTLKLDTVNLTSGNTPTNSPLKDITTMLESMGWTSKPTSTVTSADELLAKRNEMLNSPEIKAAQDSYLENKKKYQEIQDTYAAIEDDVRKSYNSSNATESYILAQAAKRQKELQPLLQKAYREAAFSQEEYSLMLGNAKENYNAFTDALKMQKTDEQAQLQEKSMYLSAIGQAFNIYNQTPEGKKQQMQIEYDFNNPSLNSTDPTEVNRAITNSITEQMKTLTALGIPFQQSSGQIIAKIQKDIKGGMSPQEAIENNFMKGVREKPQWKALSKSADEKVQYGIIGVDDNNNPIYGFINLSDQTVSPTNSSSSSPSPGSVDGFNLGVTENFDFSNVSNPNFGKKVNKDAGLNNNNPGNIRPSAGRTYPGAIGVSESGFVIFDTPQHGWDALVSDIAAKKAGGPRLPAGSTLLQMIEMYAPKSDGNNPAVYAADVAKKVGATINTPINQIDTLALSKAIASHDSPGMYNLLFGAGNRSLTKDGQLPKKVPVTAASQSGQIDTLIKSDKNFELANNILNGIGSYPSKTDKNYSKVINAMGQIVDAKIATTDDPQLKKIYESAKYTKEVEQGVVTKLTDAFTVLSTVSNLTTQLENMEEDVGPLEGLLRNKNPYDVNAQSIAAQLNALVPKVARGVFGEVGVLTDQDVARYMKTLPNNKMPKDVSKIVGDLLKVTVTKAIINNITTLAKGQRNVVNFSGDYEMAKDYLASKGISPNPRDSYATNSLSNSATIKSPLDFINSLYSN